MFAFRQGFPEFGMTLLSAVIRRFRAGSTIHRQSRFAPQRNVNCRAVNRRGIYLGL